MIKYNTPQELFTAICDKIRDKTNSNELINHQDIPDKINKLIGNDTKLFINSAIQGENTIRYSFNNTTITKISSRIFATTNLTAIDLPECTSIESNAFENCTSLTTVNLPKCTSIGDYAFEGCTNLTTIDLPKCATITYEAFRNCTSLTTVNIPECTTIKNEAFDDCTSLTTVNLPKCTYIGGYAFEGCTNLTTLILSSNQMANVSDSTDGVTFYNTRIANGTGYIYVPDNLVDSYKTATNWSTYANQIKPLSELPSELKEEYNL